MFENIFGQQKVKEILSNQIKNLKLAHAYIFMGQDGVGKQMMALELAKTINCITNDFLKNRAGACGICSSCKKIDKNIHPDVHFINFAKQAELENSDIDKQKIIKIETIRYMQKEVYTKVHEGKWKIFIIEPAEKMNAAAANSLLKTLEEPPENTIIILIARHKETIPKTIVSRSQLLFFQALNRNIISNWITSKYPVNSSKAEAIAEISEGSIENAKKLIESNEHEEISLWHKLKTKKFYISDILELSKNTAKSGALECVDTITREARKEFRIYPRETIYALELLNNARELLLKNVNAQTVLDNLFLELMNS